MAQNSGQVQLHKKRKGKQGLHGEIYQLKLLMLFLKRGVDNRYSFQLSTEKKEAKKFDDLFFELTVNGKKEYRLLQAKHKEKADKITFDHLLTQSDGDYSLVKYFFSYLDSKNDKFFQNGVIKDITLCTNIGLDLNDEYHLNGVPVTIREIVQEMKDIDNILDVNSAILVKKGVRYRFQYNSTALLLKPKLQNYNLTKLARSLVECILKNKDVQINNNIFQPYHAILAKEVIDVDRKMFIDKFVNQPNTLSNKANTFRDILMEEVKRQSLGKLQLENINAEVAASRIGKDFKLQDGFGMVSGESWQQVVIPDLAKNMIDSIVNAKPINHNKSPFNCCHGLLAKEVFDMQAKKFLGEFISGIGISEDAKKLRDALEREAKLQGIMSLEEMNKAVDNNKAKGKIALNLSSGFGVGKVKGWPNDAISDKDIKDFLEHLIFAVNQPGEQELGKIVANDIGKEFNFVAKDYVYNKLFVKMLEWLNGKGKEFISYENGKEFFDEAKQELNELELNGLTLDYKFKVEEFVDKFGIVFHSKTTRNIGLDNFITSEHSNEQVLNVMSQQSVLSAIKVYQVLQGMDRSQETYIFMQLDSVLRLKDHTTQAFKGNRNLLIIECNIEGKEDNVQILYEQLYSIVQRNNKKKVLFITQKQGDLLANKFKSAIGNKYQEKEDGYNSLADLTADSQNEVLSEKIMFQGEKVSLDTLIKPASKYLVDAEVLSKLINEEKIEVDKAPADSNYNVIKDCFIDRTFERCTIIEKSIKEEKNDFFVFEKQGIKSNPKSDQDIISICDVNKNFQKLCNTYKKHNVHWLKKKRDYLIWQQSHGTLSKLRKFVGEQNNQKWKPEKITDIPDRIVIIAAEPGMGKSAVLIPLALKTKESDRSLWIVRINLVDQSSQFNEWKKNNTKIDELQAVKFLYGTIDFRVFRENGELTVEKKKQIITDILELVSLIDNREIDLISDKERKFKGLNLLELGLFYNFFLQGKIVLLLDGFDEISPDYKDQVIKLLEVLKGTKVKKIWVTTRPYDIQSEPENTLSTFSYELKPFIMCEQRSFLKKFWEKKFEFSELDERRLDLFIEEILHWFSESTNDQEREFFNIPLQIVMIAENFCDDCKEFCYSHTLELSVANKQAISNKLNLINLYESFIKIEIDRELKKEIPNLDCERDKPQMKEFIEKQSKKFNERHEKLAVYAMFRKDKLEKLLSKQEIEKVHGLLDEIKQAKLKTGIIDRITNDKPNFIHLTFAEYFVANYLWKKFKSIQFDEFENFIENIIINNLIKDDRLQICKFFVLKTQKDLENDKNFADREDKLKTLAIKLVAETFRYGPCKNIKQSTKLLLKIIEFSLLTKEGSAMIRYVQTLKRYKKMALLYVSAEMGYKTFARTLQMNEQFLKDYLRDHKWFYNPLWIAIKKGHLDLMKEILIDKFSYDSNWEDKHGKCLLQFILEKKDYDVLRSCLKLDVVDVHTTYQDYNNLKVLPLAECLMNKAPKDIIELLIQKTNIKFVNQLKIGRLGEPAVVYVIGSLASYDINFLDILIEKDINLNAGYENGATPLNCITSYEFVPRFRGFSFKELQLGCDYILDKATFFEKYFDFDIEFGNSNLVKSLLENGAVYNLVDRHHNTPLQYVTVTHYIQKLFKAVFQTADMKYEEGVLINLQYQVSCFQNYQKIQPLEETFFEPVKIKNMLYQAYAFDDYKCKLMKKASNELSLDLQQEYEDEMDSYKFEDFTAYDIFFKLENRNTRTSSFLMCLFKRVLELFIDKNYEFGEAVNQVSKGALELYKKEQRAYDEILNAEVMENILSKINECHGGIHFLEKILKAFHRVNQKDIKKDVESIVKFCERSSPTFELLKTIEDLFDAVNTNNKENIVKILQNAEPSIVETAIKVHNKWKQTLLDLAKEHNDVEITSLLRQYGAKLSSECRQRNPATFAYSITSILDKATEPLPFEEYWAYPRK